MPETWMDIFKKYKPEITEKEAEYILWNETCFPLDTQTTIIQIENYFKKKAMNPKEMAQKLYGSYAQILMMNSNPKYRSSKMIKGCVRIHVDGILKLSGLPQYQIIFWQQVKTEIEKL